MGFLFYLYTLKLIIMTAQEFKIKHPQYSDLGGDDLWNRMELMLLYEQQQKRHNFRKRKWWEYVIIEKR